MQGILIKSAAPGLAQPVTRINLVEIFDDFTKIQQGDFIMTTGYAWEQYCGDGHGVIAALVERHAVCLAFQEDIYQAALPLSLVAAAEQKKFTLLLMPRHFTFRRVSQAWATLCGVGAAVKLPPHFAAPLASEYSALPGLAELPDNVPATMDAHGLLNTFQVQAQSWLEQHGLGNARQTLPEFSTIQMTLKIWLQESCNLSQAASVLGVHRHTVRNRLQQFASASGLDLGSHAVRLMLALAYLPAQAQ